MDIITNDECDNCNQLFGKTIEQDFISIFDLPRLMYNIKKKNGYPHKFIGNNYLMEKEGNDITISYKIKNIDNNISDINKLPQKVILTPLRSFPEQNIYKTLCKYVFGVLDNDTLSCFDHLRKWIIGEIQETKLPKVARFYHPEVATHPHIMLYVRKDDARKDLPHVVAEIKIISLVFVLILPFSDKDTYTYYKEEDYQRFWNFFELYSQVPGWQFSYCNKLEKKYPKICLQCNENNSTE